MIFGPIRLLGGLWLGDPAGVAATLFGGLLGRLGAFCGGGCGWGAMWMAGGGWDRGKIGLV